MSSQATCYYPDKSRATTYVACNATLAGPDGVGSACCDAGDICTTGGFCLNDSYYPYRGACTDRSWNSNSCASECLNVNPNRDAAAVPCGPQGNYNGLFCCSEVGTTSCCNATFPNIFGKPFAPTTVDATAVNDTSCSNASAVNTNSTTPIRHSSSDAMKIGVGVGVPLGLLLLLSLVFAAWTERRRRRDIEKIVRRTDWSGKQWIQEKTTVDGGNNLRYEVEGGEREIQELGDRTP